MATSTVWAQQRANIDNDTNTPAQKVLPTFGGYMLTPGPLFFDGGSLSINEDWSTCSYDKSYGFTKGSTFFSFVELGRHFDSRGQNFSMSSGSINNEGENVIYAGYDDWRLPTQKEWEAIIGTAREGATVNGIPHACFSMIMVKDMVYAGMKGPVGLLLFPDGEEITGKRFFEINQKRVTHDFLRSDLEDYISKGCVFLPSAGYYSIDRLHWYFGGALGNYLSSVSRSENESMMMSFSSSSIPVVIKDLKVFHFLQVRLIR